MTMITRGAMRKCSGCGTLVCTDSDVKKILCPTCGKILHVNVRLLVDTDKPDEPDLFEKSEKLDPVPDDI